MFFPLKNKYDFKHIPRFLNIIRINNKKGESKFYNVCEKIYSSEAQRLPAFFEHIFCHVFGDKSRGKMFVK